MNPYENLPESAFWKSAVASRSMFDIGGLWSPKFDLRESHSVATFGSCFAQHIGAALEKRGFDWLNTEPPPRGLSPESCKRYNYNVFTCRTGNIYTASLLFQWTRWALGNEVPPSEYWEKNGRIYDPFRPNIEPNGFASVEEMLRSREQAIISFKRAIKRSDVFVFTLGLTESWFNTEGYEYPMCPGTVAGTFDSARHTFCNQDFTFIAMKLGEAFEEMRKASPGLRFILTVSPVPLTATYSGQHVLVSTMASKSILRAVAEHFTRSSDDIDYFPSYEIINATPFRGAFFEPNQRSVNPHGVDHVMDSFFRCLVAKFPRPAIEQVDRRARRGNEVCEEELLGAFGK